MASLLPGFRHNQDSTRWSLPHAQPPKQESHLIKIFLKIRCRSIESCDLQADYCKSLCQGAYSGVKWCLRDVLYQSVPPIRFLVSVGQYTEAGVHSKLRVDRRNVCKNEGCHKFETVHVTCCKTGHSAYCSSCTVSWHITVQPVAILLPVSPIFGHIQGGIRQRKIQQWLFYVYWTLHHLDSWIKIDQLDVTCFIISLFNAQHVSDVSTSILRSLRLICWVISWVVLLWFDLCWCYGVVWYPYAGWSTPIGVMITEAV